MSKKKKKDADVKNDAMENMPDTDKSGKKQKELPGMPKLTPLEKQAQKVLFIWSNLKEIRDSLKLECDNLLPLMKEEGRYSLTLTNDENEKIEIKLTESNEKIQISKKKESGL
jgi:hypothetical protein